MIHGVAYGNFEVSKILLSKLAGYMFLAVLRDRRGNAVRWWLLRGRRDFLASEFIGLRYMVFYIVRIA